MIKAIIRLAKAYYYYLISSLGCYLLEKSLKHVERELELKPTLDPNHALIHQALSEPQYDEETDQYSVEVRLEVEGQMANTTLYYPTEDEAYEFYNHIRLSMEPVVMRF